MATTVIQQKVVADLGSDEYRLLRKSYNELLVSYYALLDAIVAGPDFATLQTAVTAMVAANVLDSDLVKVVDSKELPRARRFPR